METRDSGGHVNVEQAEQAFRDLDERWTHGPSSSTSREEQSVLGEDAEKGERPFDLREYLSASNDANERAGIKHKHVTVTWDNLRVEVQGGQDHKEYVPTFGDAVLNFFLAPLFWIWAYLRSRSMTTRTILHESSGVLKPGEMCLVLGCPGAGCSTFLKAIANQRDGYAVVGGDVLYAGMGAEEMAKYYKGEVVYNQEDDIHLPTLTVAQTLTFALSLKTPGRNGRLAGVSADDFKKEVQETLLKMLSIQHTSQTLVGDEFVRGISGGEKKRVSIAEMMATRARVQCWDNSTRGLDASNALDFAKCLRIMTDVLGQTTFVSLYQAGEGIYSLFDKVLVLDSGRQVFFGPPDQARAYFEGLGYNALPRQSTADYLTGCTDPNERQFMPGRSHLDVPSTPEALETVFRTSRFHRDSTRDLQDVKARMQVEKADQEAFRQAVLDDKKRGVSKKNPYTQGLYSQIRALTIRQFQMRLQDRFQLYTMFGLTTFLALVTGAAFIDLPLSSAGAFTRGGLIFSGMLTVSLDAFGELPMQILGRPIVQKQTAYSFYRPTATVVANTLSDLPFSAVRVLIFNIIIYFMSGLYRSAGAFFSYHLFIYLASLTMQGFFRTFGLLCKNFDTAFRFSTMMLPPLIEYAGYLIQLDTMKRWLFWIYYLNPLGYAFAGAMENEFSRISFTCDGSSVVPRNSPGMSLYPNSLGSNQACTLYGYQPGASEISGRDYLQTGYQLDVRDQWRRNLPVLIVFMLFFQLTQIIAIEFYPQYVYNRSTKTFVKESEESRRLNEELKYHKEEKLNRPRNLQNGDSSPPLGAEKEKTNRKAFTWERLSYIVPIHGGTKQLLHGIYGYVKPGQLVALMGASGAGKTTCLDVLAQRKTIGIVTGEMSVGGQPLGPDFARGVAYAEQMDVHEGTATVREALRFSAYLRQPTSVPQSEKDQYVEELIELLELQDLTEALVFSLSLEARKRLTIGVELASKPELLLFLDEPTSGLDSQSAWNLVRFLRKLANQGQAIICTIHQPSSLLFESFDRLLLLERGGETVYFGDIGPDSCVLREYFARHGAPCPSNVNPAEFILEAIGAGSSPRIGLRDWKDIWLESKESKNVKEMIESLKASCQENDGSLSGSRSTYATSFFTQLSVVVKRNNAALWRSPEYVFSRWFIHVAISVWVSLSFLQLGNSSRDVQYRIFGLYWTTLLPGHIMSQLQPMFIKNRSIFIRESASRIYSPYVFVIGQLIGEVPYSILCAVSYWVLMAYPMGFGKGVLGQGGIGFQLLVLFLLELFGVSLGQMFAAISPSIQVAVLFNPVFAVILTTFCGVTIPYPTLKSFWIWVYHAVPYTRSLAAMVSTELHGLPIRCKPEEFAVFNPPSGQTCLSWTKDFVGSFGGYVDNLNDTMACRYCQYSVGDEYFEPLNIAVSNRWRDVLILLSFPIFNMFITILASRFLHYAKR